MRESRKRINVIYTVVRTARQWLAAAVLAAVFLTVMQAICPARTWAAAGGGETAAGGNGTAAETNGAAVGGGEHAAAQRVYDQAGLFSAAERSALEDEIKSLQDEIKMDVVVVTTEDALGKSAADYADDFYDEGGFGTRRDHSGILYLIDMDNRELYISTSGAMIRFVTDSRIEEMLDYAYRYVQNGDFAGSARQFVKDTEYWYREGIPGGQYNYDAETGEISRYHSITWYEALFALAVAGFSAGAVCIGVKRQYAMKEQHQQASNFSLAYRADARFAYSNQNDALVHSFVTRKLIPRPRSGGPGSGMSGGGGAGRSTVHRSGAGRTHGGGGRKF